MRIVRTVAFVALATSVWAVAPASAQPMGTFRWQLQPYCNVISVTVVQQDGQYQLDGTDNQCGAPQAASVRGLAFFNPNGSIGFGLSVVTAPGGTPVHIDATIDMSLSGTWRDSAGNSGTFTFTPGGIVPGLPPRPLPSGGLAPNSVTTVQIAAAAVTSAKIAADAVTGVNVADGSLTVADLLDAPRAAFAGGPQVLTLTPTPVVARTVTLTVPANGTVIVNASGWFSFNDTTATREAAVCSITTTNAMETMRFASSDGSTTVGDQADAFAATRGFAVTPGTFTVNLVCFEFAGNVLLLDTSMTAMFVGQ